MDETGGLAPDDVFAIFVRIVVGVLLVWLVVAMMEKRMVGELFIGLCILVAGFTIARAIRKAR